MATMEEPLAQLSAEHAEMEQLLRNLAAERWDTPSSAASWSVQDQVSHLADTNDICVDSVLGGPRALNDVALTFSSPEAFTQSAVDKGRAMTPEQVFEWWRSSAAATRDALATRGPKDRVEKWGLGMSAPMMATARLMEHWAHGCDIRAGLGVPFSRTPRLKSVAFLTLRAVPYALGVAKVEQPPGTLRAELDYEGETWRLGPDHTTDLIAGDAFEFCRLGIRRISRDETTLKAQGPLAEAALDNLRAFL